MTAKILGRNQMIHSSGLLYEFWYQTPNFDDLGNFDPDCDESGFYVKDVIRDRVLGYVYRFDGEFWIDSPYCTYFHFLQEEITIQGQTKIVRTSPVGWSSLLSALDHFLTTYSSSLVPPAPVAALEGIA